VAVPVKEGSENACAQQSSSSSRSCSTSSGAGKERHSDPPFAASRKKGARLKGELGSPILVVVLDPSLESATLCNFTPKDFGFVVSTSLTNPLCLPF